MTETIEYSGWTITVIQNGDVYEATTSHCTCHDSQTFTGATRQEAIDKAMAWCNDIPF